ncbi:MAG TPA: TadE/TadG family type IV pilus assembly protein [Hyphomicrobiales bacterium]|nr:TadE/TadG family type IV pilus assembly protein [Hyphomicrobiales bacterium]
MATSALGLLGRFRHDRRAVSAVEFALCLPFMLMLYLGGIELSQAVSADRKVTLLARTVGDLVAQNDAVTTSQVGAIFDAASAVLYPFPTTAGGSSILSVSLAEIWTYTHTDGTTTSNLEWSCSATAGSLGSPSCAASSDYASCTLPDVTTAPLETLPAPEVGNATIKAVVSYSWTPTIAAGVVGPLTLSQTIYLRPRLSTHVCWSATSSS